MEDEANYYMEREWRVAGNVKFEIGDVCRIFLPKAYFEQFNRDLPEYSGPIKIIE
jgi:hypothetical protein